VSDADARQQCEVYYSGRVQGVGFRYTVRWLAGRFAVTGFVRNLSDGRVHLVAEGEVDEVGRFLEAVRREIGQYVRDTQEKSSPATGKFKTFDIRF